METTASPSLIDATPQRKYFSTAGRPPGVRNKISTKCKANIEAVFNGLGGWEAMLSWAQRNKDTFYTSIYPRMLATEQDGKVGTGSIKVIVYGPNSSIPNQSIDITPQPVVLAADESVSDGVEHE